jgi:tRNA(Ile)-lysidine synthase
MALVSLLMEAGHSGQTLLLAHMNHHWSPWGNEAEAFVRTQATNWNLPLVVGHAPGKPERNAEAEARKQRLNFLRELIEKENLQGVILAHTRTDVVESFLMRAGKGSGVTGLSSLAQPHTQLEGVNVWRPLLTVGREELRTYLQSHNLPWLNDPADAAGHNQRARVRLAAPNLAALGLTEEGLYGCVQNLLRAEELLNTQAQALWAEHVQLPNGIRFPLADVRQWHPEMAQRLLALALHTLQRTPGPLPRTSKRLALWARLCAEPAGKATLGGLTFRWKEAALDILAPDMPHS